MRSGNEYISHNTHVNLVIGDIVLKEIIRKELLSDQPVEIGPDVLDSIIKYITESFWWCLSRLELRVCEDFNKLINDILDSLARVRIQKFIEVGLEGNSRSFDAKALQKFINALIKFYRLSFKGHVDSDGNVYVRVINDFEINGKRYIKGGVVPIDVIKALALEILGLVKIIE